MAFPRRRWSQIREISLGLQCKLLDETDSPSYTFRARLPGDVKRAVNYGHLAARLPAASDAGHRAGRDRSISLLYHQLPHLAPKRHPGSIPCQIHQLLACVRLLPLHLFQDPEEAPRQAWTCRSARPKPGRPQRPGLDSHHLQRSGHLPQGLCFLHAKQLKLERASYPKQARQANTMLTGRFLLG